MRGNIIYIYVGMHIVRTVTPHACARGKAISSVIVVVVIIVHTKIARSRDLGILVNGQYYQDVENGVIFASKCLIRTDQECYKSCYLVATPISHTH